MTTPEAIVKVANELFYAIVIMWVFYLLFGHCSTCACEPKPCIQAPLPPPKTSEEYLKALYARPTYDGIGIASLVVVSVNCMFLAGYGTILLVGWLEKFSAGPSRGYRR